MLAVRYGKCAPRLVSCVAQVQGLEGTHNIFLSVLAQHHDVGRGRWLLPTEHRIDR